MVIIAVDFDGILCTNKFPLIGEPIPEMINAVKKAVHTDDVEVILWTSRTDKPLEDAVSWCAEQGIQFSAINDNSPSNKAQYSNAYPNGTRKVFADFYIDDHNLEFISPSFAARKLNKLLERLNKNGINKG